MIQVFKTSVKTKADARKLTPLLNNFLQDNKWNFDLADCDKILRVVATQGICDDDIVMLLKENGYHCEVLTT